MVDSRNTQMIERLLRERNIPFIVRIQDIGQLLAKEKINSGMGKFAKLRNHKTIDWKDYYPLNCIYEFIDSLETEFPSTCSSNIVGKTEEGRDLKVLKISNSCASNSGIWIDGTIHAREWISTSVVTYIADYLARNFSTLPEYITNKDWYIMPVVNPDGYAYSHVHDRMWRKNRGLYYGRPCGVDLNRNFGHNWARCSDYSSKDPNHTNYRGTEAFSEPETTAIKDVILYSNTPFKVFLSFHSYSEVITFPWCHVSDPCDDYVSLLEGGTIMAKAVYEASGHMYKVGSFKDLMYSASGTNIDWSYGSRQIPYSYLVELGDKDHRFLLPKEDILSTCNEMLHGVIALMDYVDQNNDLIKPAKCSTVQRNNRLKK